MWLPRLRLVPRLRWLLLGACLSSATWLVALLLYLRLDGVIRPQTTGLPSSSGPVVPGGPVVSSSGPVVPDTQPDLAKLALVRTEEEKQQRADGYKAHAFNTLVSDRLSLRRQLPDTRHDL